MPTDDFPIGKEFDCPDCLLTNGHYDAITQINFCAYCKRRNIQIYNSTAETCIGLTEALKDLDVSE